MDTFSALRAATRSGIGGFSLNSAKDIASSVAKSIPQAELKQLDGANSDNALHAAKNLSTVGSSGASFENMLGNFASEVNQKQAATSSSVDGLLGGGNVSLHQAMISMEEANVSFQMMVEVRNRLMDGYQELMRMQV